MSRYKFLYMAFVATMAFLVIVTMCIADAMVEVERIRAASKSVPCECDTTAAIALSESAIDSIADAIVVWSAVGTYNPRTVEVDVRPAGEVPVKVYLVDTWENIPLSGIIVLAQNGSVTMVDKTSRDGSVKFYVDPHDSLTWEFTPTLAGCINVPLELIINKPTIDTIWYGPRTVDFTEHLYQSGVVGCTH